MKAKEDTFSVGDRVKVSDNIRCRQHGQTGTIVQIDPEDKYGWKSFIVKFDDEKYGAMGFQSGNIDKINEKGTTMKKINENTKITLTVGQLKRLIKEGKGSSKDFEIRGGILVKYNGAGGDVVIPDGITSIGNKAFYDCSDLTSVMIPGSVTSIGDKAFSNCIKLANVKILNPRLLRTVNKNRYNSFEDTPWAEKPKSRNIGKFYGINNKECAIAWIKGGGKCVYRYGFRFRDARSSKLSDTEAMKLIKNYSFGMGFYNLSWTRDEYGNPALEFNELSANDMW